MQEALRSILSQDLQYSNQSKTSPISREEERNSQFINVFAVKLYDLGSSSKHTTNDDSYIPWFPDFDITLEAIDAGSCIPWFLDFNDSPRFEAPSSTTGVGNYVQGFEPNI